MSRSSKQLERTGAVIVAHPDDESLWCGGALLQQPDVQWFVLTLCRGSDTDRAPRFARVLRYLRATGAMADLDDGPAQEPLAAELVQRTILEGLPRRAYDVIFTHGPQGEYTRHRRHEECSAAVTALWLAGQLESQELKLFAYEDQGRTTLPRVRLDADQRNALDAQTFARKQHIITNLYGFGVESWEARAVPATEGFYCATTAARALALAAMPGHERGHEGDHEGDPR